MLTRRKASVVVRPEAAHAVLPPLPTTCVLDILARLNPGERLLSMQVSHGWRAAVCAPGVWRCVDLTPSVFPGHVSEHFLRAVVAKAVGHVHTLRLHVGTYEEDGAKQHVAVSAAVKLCPTLRTLELLSEPFCGASGCFSVHTVDEVLAAAPNLVSFAVDVSATTDKLHAMLCNEGRYACLRMRCLSCHHPHGVVPSRADADACVATLVADLRRHPSLRELSLESTLADASLEGLVEAVTAAGLEGVDLRRASPLPFFAPPLTRLLRDSRRLVYLSIDGLYGGVAGLLADDTVGPFAAALRSNTWLTRLELTNICLWDVVGRGAAVVAALVDHHSIALINLDYNRVLPADHVAVGNALAQLVAANAPALARLSIRHMALGEGGLRPLLAALSRNTHLRQLGCGGWDNDDIGKRFVLSTLVPAVKANASLRRLWAGPHGGPAVKLVAARAAANGNS